MHNSKELLKEIQQEREAFGIFKESVKSRQPKEMPVFRKGDMAGKQRPYIRETMHSALNLYCTLRAQLISATRGRASQPTGVSYGHRLQCHLSAGIGAAQISIT